MTNFSSLVAHKIQCIGIRWAARNGPSILTSAKLEKKWRDKRNLAGE